MGTKHEFVADIPRLLVFPPIHHQGPLDGVVLARDPPCQRVDIRQQPVAELVVVEQDRLNLVIGPQLVVNTVSVGAEDGTKDTELEPARVELLIRGSFGGR